MGARQPLLLAIFGLVALAGCGSGAPAPPTSNSSTTSVAPSPSATTPRTTPPPMPSSSAAPTPADEYRWSIGAVTDNDLGESWHAGCPVDPAGLRAVDVTHWGYDGATHSGRLIVAAEVADDIAAIMGDLFRAGFPIQRMVPVAEYGGDDDASMAANNSSAFNCRAITGGTGWSRHAYGLAIDLDPVANPYVSGDLVLPPAGAAYLDRSRDLPGMIRTGDDVVAAFTARGWSWGGSWEHPIDYQHFSAGSG